MLGRASRVALIACLLAGMLTGVAHGEPEWTTYHRDPGRSGENPEATQPIAPVLAWQTGNLGAPIWGQPLVLGSHVYVASVGDGLYELNAATGTVEWQQSAGTPVPSGELPCGDITPTVGIVGTPVIDTTTHAIYAVADTWNAGTHEAQHVLKGYDLTSGAQVLSTPVDPPGADPKALLQRTALNLDGGNVVFGFGGNDGDCGDYQGAVVAVPENGSSPRFWQYKPKAPAFAGAAVWGASGPVVDGEGEIFAATGNPNSSGGEMETFDDSDALLRLDPATDLVSDPASEPGPLGWFEPPTWQADSNSDADLGSAGPELLPGGMVFQAGKNGTGYLLPTSMSGNTSAVYEGQVCNGAGSFGGDAFANGVIYVACTNGVQALAYKASGPSGPSFTPLWQGPSEALGPPIVSAGLVWSLATPFQGGAGTTLYGLDTATGTPTYTETLPSAVIDHFASPSAAGGRLFVATGESVTAYQIAQLPAGGTTSPSLPVPIFKVGAATPSLVPTLLHRHLHANRHGRVRVALRCPAAAGTCRGTVTLVAEITEVHHRGRHRVRRVVAIRLARTRYASHEGDFSVILRLNAARELACAAIMTGLWWRWWSPRAGEPGGLRRCLHRRRESYRDL